MIRLLIWLGLVLTIASCAPLVDVKFDEKTDFTRYQTYYFYPTISSGLDEFEDELVMETLDLLLQTRNFKQDPAADFLVNFYVIESQESFDHLGADYYKTGATVQEFVLDFVDKEKDELIWQGRITGRITNGITDSQLHRYYERLIAELLRNYPPKK